MGLLLHRPQRGRTASTCKHSKALSRYLHRYQHSYEYLWSTSTHCPLTWRVVNLTSRCGVIIRADVRNKQNNSWAAAAVTKSCKKLRAAATRRHGRSWQLHPAGVRSWSWRTGQLPRASCTLQEPVNNENAATAAAREVTRCSICSIYPVDIWISSDGRSIDPRLHAHVPPLTRSQLSWILEPR